MQAKVGGAVGGQTGVRWGSVGQDGGVGGNTRLHLIKYSRHCLHSLGIDEDFFMYFSHFRLV